MMITSDSADVIMEFFNPLLRNTIKLFMKISIESLPLDLRVIISVYFGKVEKLKNHFHKIFKMIRVPEMNLIIVTVAKYLVIHWRRVTADSN